MSRFLDVAKAVLESVGRPLTTKEIYGFAEEKGLLRTAGKTPWKSLEARLSSDILQNKSASPFMRTEKGRYTLRKYRGIYQEYIAARAVKALMDEDIAVIDIGRLDHYIDGPGLRTSNIDPQSLLADCWSLNRREAENRFDVIQLVSFYIVRFENLILTHLRTKRLPESRLHGLYSLGFGGHIQKSDVKSLFNYADSNLALMYITRELEEELILPELPTIEFKGLLYDTSKEVSRQHIGIVYDVRAKSSDFVIGERGFLMDAKYESLDQIALRRHEFENWSTIVLDGELACN